MIRLTRIFLLSCFFFCSRLVIDLRSSCGEKVLPEKKEFFFRKSSKRFLKLQSLSGGDQIRLRKQHRQQRKSRILLSRFVFLEDIQNPTNISLLNLMCVLCLVAGKINSCKYLCSQVG